MLEKVKAYVQVHKTPMAIAAVIAFFIGLMF